MYLSASAAAEAAEKVGRWMRAVGGIWGRDLPPPQLWGSGNISLGKFFEKYGCKHNATWRIFAQN